MRYIHDILYMYIYIQKIKESMEEWKNKSSSLQRENDEFDKEKNELNKIIEKLKEQNQQLISRNEQLEYTMPQLTIENEHLREQIQEMILTSDEAIKQHRQINNKSRETADINNMNNNFASSSTESSDQEILLKLNPKHSRNFIDRNDIMEEKTFKKLKTPKLSITKENEKEKEKDKDKDKDKTNIIKRNKLLKKKQKKNNGVTINDLHEKTTSKNSSLLAIASDHETDNILSDASINTEENRETISSIKSQLARSDEKGRLISKHESQNSMTAIVNLFQKTKQNMASQTQDLEALEDQVSGNDDDDYNALLNEDILLTQSGDDSFSDHLGLIEDMLNGNGNTTENKHSNQLLDDDMDSMDDYIPKITTKNKNKNKNKNKKKIHLMHSDTDTIETDNDAKYKKDDKLTKFLATPDGSNDSNDSNDRSYEASSSSSSSSTSSSTTNVSDDEEPPIFWNPNDIPTDRSLLQQMISNPNEILDNVMSPSAQLLNNNMMNALSDWDKGSNDSSIEPIPKKKPKKKKKSLKGKRRKSSAKNIDDLNVNDIIRDKSSTNQSKKRSSRKLDKDELAKVNNNNNNNNNDNNDSNNDI